jgi:hypothetical protein
MYLLLPILQTILTFKSGGLHEKHAVYFAAMFISTVFSLSSYLTENSILIFVDIVDCSFGLQAEDI